jgi:16S rRNA (adenine1518-N6/adenine1519-N6)-dimethyltransferase
VVTPRAGRRQRRLGQNFLADSNLLDAIVREAALESGDVVLEVGGGGGALTERLAPEVGRLHVVELDERLRPELEPLAAEAGNVDIVWDDAVRVDLGALDPPPNKLVSNLPYSIATPLLLRTIAELPSVGYWLAMVQLEVGERLVSGPGTRAYGSPSVMAQLSCDVTIARRVDPAVFTPRPRVGSALVRMVRRGAAPPPGTEAIVRGAFAHRRKALARSLELARPGSLVPAREALESMGKPADARAESLAPADFARLGELLGEGDGR